MADLQFHPLAELFPLMDGVEFDALVADIREHGLREPIITYENMILDGRNRFRACEVAEVKPKFEPWDEEGSAQAFVVSRNLHRRHLNESQRAMIAARLASAQAGQRSDLMRIRTGSAPTTAQEAAEMLNVGRTAVFAAKKVLADGSPEEIEAADKGDASVEGVANQIRASVPPATRAKKRAASLSQSGKNPERIQRQQIAGEVWGRIRDSLTHLTSLPVPSEVVPIVSKWDKGGLVDARLADAMKWLEAFHNAWCNHDKAA